jgi:hypothetical protein
MFESTQDNSLYIAIDHGSGGIVASHTNQFIMDTICSCFMDVNYNICYPWDLYGIEEVFWNELKENEKDFRIGTEKFPVYFENTTASFARFKEIKQLVQTRLPYYEFLYSTSKYYYNRYSFGFTDQNDKDAAHILQTPELLSSYAKALDTSEIMAKQELQMDVEMIKTTRANIFIAYNYYSNKISQRFTREELDPLMLEIQVGFKYGHNYE